MGIFGKKEINKIDLKHIEKKGYDLIKEVSFDDEYLVIKEKFNKKSPVIKLKLDRITELLETTDTEIKTKSKSVLGRAMIGGVFLGPTGAVIGGLSGTKDKIKEEIKFLLIINYLDSNSEVQALIFEQLPGRLNLSKFVKSLKTKCKINEEVEREIYL